MSVCRYVGMQVCGYVPVYSRVAGNMGSGDWEDLFQMSDPLWVRVRDTHVLVEAGLRALHIANQNLLFGRVPVNSIQRCRLRTYATRARHTDS